MKLEQLNILRERTDSNSTLGEAAHSITTDLIDLQCQMLQEGFSSSICRICTFI